jgi:translation initiation factor 2 subunit 2
MSELQADLPERKPRKSVAFSEGATIVDSDGQVTESKEVNGGKSTAESHSGEASPPTGQDAYTQNETHELTSGVTGDADKEVEEVTDMFADLAKKVRTKWKDTRMAMTNGSIEEEEVVQEEGGW